MTREVILGGVGGEGGGGGWRLILFCFRPIVACIKKLAEKNKPSSPSVHVSKILLIYSRS